MGVYIKGMKKPNNCGSCRFNESNTHCFITKGKIDRDDYTCEFECPLVEVKTPHDRLIDAGDANERIRKKLGIRNLDYLLEAEKPIAMSIKESPTVIEAEGSE